MLFNEPTFLFLFLPALLILYYVLPWALRGGAAVAAKAPRPPLDESRPWTRYRNLLLLVASLIFYAWGGGQFVLLMLASIVFNYTVALCIDATRGRRSSLALLIFGLAVNILFLGYYKYADFMVGNLNTVAASLGQSPWSLPGVLLPIGISFFTFHALSYLLDVYWGKVTVQRNPFTVALYIFLFPQLIAGPIVRYRDISEQFVRRFADSEKFAYGVRRFIVGLGKKVIIANTVALPADQIFGLPEDQLTTGLAWLGAVCYTLQIYFDFSGYSDMAVGLGRMFGFEFIENFAYPYGSASITEFWRRWHISLSTWFRDYLYIPLGGNRVAPIRLYANLLTVFFLCGLWHGASWTFVLWGLYHGAFLVIERLGWLKRVTETTVLRHVYVMLAVMVGWVFFRADSLPGALAMLKAMAGFGVPSAQTLTPVSGFLDRWTLSVLILGVIGSVPVWPAMREAWRRRAAAMPTPAGTTAVEASLLVLRTAAMATIMLGCAMLIAAKTYSPFIYFRF